MRNEARAETCRGTVDRAEEDVRRRATGAAGAALFLAVLLQAFPARAELIDRVVAAVNTDVITLSELQQAIGINEAVGGTERDRGRLAAQTLDGIINRKLLHQEARKLKFVDVSPEETAVEVEKLKARLGSERAYTELLERLDMTSAEISRMLGERLLVERFIERKIGLLVRVTHDEAAAYFEEHSKEFDGKRFPEAQKAVTEILLVQKIDKEVEGYLAELRSKAEIRMNSLGP